MGRTWPIGGGLRDITSLRHPQRLLRNAVARYQLAFRVVRDQNHRRHGFPHRFDLSAPLSQFPFGALARGRISRRSFHYVKAFPLLFDLLLASHLTTHTSPFKCQFIEDLTASGGVKAG